MDTNPLEQFPPAAGPPPESLAEAVLSLFHSFDPATALHELELLDDDAATTPAPQPRSSDQDVTTPASPTST